MDENIKNILAYIDQQLFQILNDRTMLYAKEEALLDIKTKVSNLPVKG